MRKSKKKSIFGPFLPKFWQTRVFPKNLARSVFSVYSPLTSSTTSEKNNDWILRKSRKVHFWALFAQIWQTWIFPKNLLQSIFTVYIPLTSSTISEKNNDWILRKSKKSPFLGPFCPNLGKREFSQKIGLCHTFELLCTPNFMQNIKKI